MYAASSMTNALEALSQEYEKNTGVEVVSVFGSSSSLARQITFGAPADVFISANQRWMDYLVEEEVIAQGDSFPLAANQLVVIQPVKYSTRSDLLELKKLPAELGSERIAIGEPNSVPAGIYAKQSLESLGLWEQVKGQLAPTKNVRMALALVSREEAPFGIVYGTDAIQDSGVFTVATLPNESHDPIIYPVAGISENNLAGEFLKFLRSEKAQTILGQYGFLRPNQEQKAKN